MGLQTGQVAGCMEAGSTPRSAVNFGGTESPAQKNRFLGARSMLQKTSAIL
jgi:hypothetical protein